MTPFFKFSKQQQKGVFLLLLIIFLLQSVLFFVNNLDAKIYKDSLGNSNLVQLNKEIDSLKLIELNKRLPKIYPFNPNFITDYKGYQLGMSANEINKLHTFRAENKWINSVKHFQKVTQVSDSLLKTMSPYFKFPEWLKERKKKAALIKTILNKRKAVKIDLNSATTKQLKKVYGIGKVLAKRILNYREKNNGFISVSELSEVYGLKEDTINLIAEKFEIKTPRKVRKLDLNTSNSDQLVTIKYIDYEVAYNIVEYRNLHGNFKFVHELLKVKDFPVEKYDIIKLYLQLN